MTERDVHTCPRCGGYLPTVRVSRPVYVETPVLGRDYTVKSLVGYEEVEEIADCVRCTGGY